MSKITFALFAAFCLVVAASGYAECESSNKVEYPAEYDELFERFRPLTSEEALMLVSARGFTSGGGWEGKPILEPIAIKSFGGEVSGYWLMAYKGDDANVRSAAEEVIAMFNAGEGFDPYEFLGLWSILTNHSREFYEFFVYGWTWDLGIGLLGGGVPGYLYDFENYLNLAEELYGEGNILKTKILVTGIRPYGWLYAFDVRDGGRRYIYDYPDGSYGGIHRGEIDEDGIREVSLGRMAQLYNHFKTKPESYDKAEAEWAETLEYIKANAVKEGGYYRLQHSREEE